MKNNPYEEKIESKCDVCNNKIMIDQYGNGVRCNICGWKQDRLAQEWTDRVVCP